MSIQTNVKSSSDGALRDESRREVRLLYHVSVWEARLRIQLLFFSCKRPCAAQPAKTTLLRVLLVGWWFVWSWGQVDGFWLCVCVLTCSLSFVSATIIVPRSCYSLYSVSGTPARQMLGRCAGNDNELPFRIHLELFKLLCAWLHVVYT